MPNKKGSKVAASRAKSQQKAKKKARQTGPNIPVAAAAPAPVEITEEDADLETGILESAVVEPEQAQPVATAPARQPARRAAAATRRERQAHALVAGSSLKREVSLIGAITAAAGVALAVLKLATDLGA